MYMYQKENKKQRKNKLKKPCHGDQLLVTAAHPTKIEKDSLKSNIS
jgi:PAB1-binding protein PBP1